MRKGTPAALSAPQAPASLRSSVQLKNARWGSVWPVSHHQPASDAAYNRGTHVGQLGMFARGGKADFAAVPQGFFSGAARGAFWNKIIDSGRAEKAAIVGEDERRTKGQEGAARGNTCPRRPDRPASRAGDTE